MLYAGIGPRNTPPYVLDLLERAGYSLARLGFTLRSGGARGADESFELGCDRLQGKKEIFLPFKNYRRNPSPYYGTDRKTRLFASEYHPNWSVVSPLGRDYLGRNAYIILGHDLDTPVNFVLTWLPSWKNGGTRHAVNIATAFHIPIFNLDTMSIDEVNDLVMQVYDNHKSA